MNGKENIIARILADADARAKSIVDEANARAQHAQDAARESAQADRAALEQKIVALTAERKANALSNAKLDARKYLLAGKQKLIADCYDKAKDTLLSMDATQKREFLTKLLGLYAEQGETVNYARADADIVTQQLLDGIGKGLVLGQACDFEGGLVLCGKSYDKDLTLTKLVQYAREKTEAAVAAVLFGGDNV